METTGVIGVTWGLIHGHILGLYWDNGKEDGNYYNGCYYYYQASSCSFAVHVGSGCRVLGFGLYGLGCML